MEHLENSNLLLSSVINLIDDLIFYKDENFKYLGCNSAFLTFINKSPAELIGKDDFEIFDHELANLFRQNYKPKVTSERMKNGSPIPMAVRYTC